MADWWEGVMKMLGLRRAPMPTLSEEDIAQDRALVAAKRRLHNLDERLGIVEAGLQRHIKSRIHRR